MFEFYVQRSDGNAASFKTNEVSQLVLCIHAT